MKSTIKMNIRRINNEKLEDICDLIIEETPLEIFVNYKFYAALMCTPIEVKELVIGFLFSEGILSSVNSIVSIEEKYENRICVVLDHEIIMDDTNVSAITSGCGNGSVHIKSLEEGSIKSIEHTCKFAIVDILKLMNEFNSRSKLFRQTGGVHSSCICNDNSLLLFSEDIGRHNALDKVVGKALMGNMGLANKLVMTTGRISSDIIIKVAKAGIQLIVSHSAPTSLAINIAKAANITVIGFARGSRMNIYCNENRII